MNFNSVVNKWMRWAIWSLCALGLFLLLVGFGGYSGVILLGWALGVVVAASLILFRKPGPPPERWPVPSYGRR